MQLRAEGEAMCVCGGGGGTLGDVAALRDKFREDAVKPGAFVAQRLACGR